MVVLFNNTPSSWHHTYYKLNLLPCGTRGSYSGLGSTSSGSVHPGSHDKREADVEEEGVSRKMRLAVTLDMQNNFSNRHLESLGLVTGGHKKTEKETPGVETMKLFYWVGIKVQFGWIRERRHLEVISRYRRERWEGFGSTICKSLIWARNI